jgi:ribosomal protein S6
MVGPLVFRLLRKAKSCDSLLAMDTHDKVQGDGRLQVYEIGFHIVPVVSVDALPAEVNAIRSLIESNGGAVIAEDAPALRGLAYPLSRMVSGKRQKFDTAHFGWVKFEIPAEHIKTIKDSLDKMHNVLRFLIIKTVKESTLLSPLKREKIAAALGGHVLSPVEARAEHKPVAGVGAAGASASPKMSDEEMDKTIDSLVEGEK